MKIKTKTQRWIPSLITALALAGSASLCQAQSLITLNNDTSESSAFYDGGPAGATYTWLSTNGPNGGGCIQGVIDGVTTHEFDPAFNVSFTPGQYLQVTFQMMVDSSSGTQGTGGSGGYGQKQLAFRDASYSWNGVGYATIFPPLANTWVTYTFSVPGMTDSVAHVQFQLQGGAAYSGPVTIYIGDVTVVPVPNPAVLSCFTNSASVVWHGGNGLNGIWDGSQDAPYYNPVTGAGPVNITPAGSVEFQPTTGSYQGSQIDLGFNPSLFQSLGIDVYYDGPTPSTTNTYGGFQMMIANAASPYNWAWIGAVNFNAGMIGQWTHFNFPCASSGVLNAAGFAFQSTPGNTGSPAGANPFTFHIDNIQAWNPVSRANIIGLTPGTPGGVQMTVDAYGTANNNDQEGITSPSADNALYDFFWINQTPATYSFTLTNSAAPAAAFASTPTAPASVGAGFDAHVYLVNGDSIVAAGQSWGYNQTYSGVPYNALDYLGLHVQNANITNLVTYTTNATVITTNTTYGLASGVVAIIDWKTNAPSANATNRIVFNFPNMASANGTWTLNFTDNTHGNLVAADGSVNSFTLPDFSSDLNYTANFTPVTSMVQFGVFKNGSSANNSLSTTFTHVVVTNAMAGITSTNYNDSFSGPGLTANYVWQVAEYYQDASDRAIWQPSGTAYWIKWNTTASGWGVQSSSNLLSSWSSGGVTYTHADSTGTNTLGAIPAASLPAGNAAFFRLTK